MQNWTESFQFRRITNWAMSCCDVHTVIVSPPWFPLPTHENAFETSYFNPAGSPALTNAESGSLNLTCAESDICRTFRLCARMLDQRPTAHCPAVDAYP